MPKIDLDIDRVERRIYDALTKVETQPVRIFTACLRDALAGRVYRQARQPKLIRLGKQLAQGRLSMVEAYKKAAELIDIDSALELIALRSTSQYLKVLRITALASWAEGWCDILAGYVKAGGDLRALQKALGTPRKLKPVFLKAYRKFFVPLVAMHAFNDYLEKAGLLADYRLREKAWRGQLPMDFLRDL